MTKATKENILTIYDEAIDKQKAVRDLSRTLDIDREELKKLLRENGRVVPYKKTAPEEETKEDAPDQAADRQLPIPNYIFEVLFKEIDRLESLIADRSAELAELSQRYTDISNFIKGYKRP